MRSRMVVYPKRYGLGSCSCFGIVPRGYSFGRLEMRVIGDTIGDMDQEYAQCWIVGA